MGNCQQSYLQAFLDPKLHQALFNHPFLVKHMDAAPVSHLHPPPFPGAIPALPLREFLLSNKSCSECHHYFGCLILNFLLKGHGFVPESSVHHANLVQQSSLVHTDTKWTHLQTEFEVNLL